MRIRSLVIVSCVAAAGLVQPVAAAAPPPPAPIAGILPPPPPASVKVPPIVTASSDAHNNFYAPPNPLPPGRNGDIIRAEPVIPAIPTPAKITRIMYRSTDTNGAPIAVTGATFEPIAPWHGHGPRPLVSFAVGSHGQGDQCAPSKLLDEVIHYRTPLDLMAAYETPFIDVMLAQGIAVVATDYEKMGTPGDHPWLNAISEGHAVIDAARAAQRLPGSHIPENGPIAFWGYSQGGNAAAGAAELEASYAPELDVRGTYVGAPPADLFAVLPYIEKSMLRGLLGIFLNGLRVSFPETGPEIDRILNEHGQHLLAAVRKMCVPEIDLRFFLAPTSIYTKSGLLLSEAMAKNPVIAKAMQRLHLGRIKPSAPVMISTGFNDDIVEPHQVGRLAEEWCSRGATVEYIEARLPTVLPGTGTGHFVNTIPNNIGSGNQWLLDRFAGKPAPSNC